MAMTWKHEGDGPSLYLDIGIWYDNGEWKWVSGVPVGLEADHWRPETRNTKNKLVKKYPHKNDVMGSIYSSNGNNAVTDAMTITGKIQHAVYYICEYWCQ